MGVPDFYNVEPARLIHRGPTGARYAYRECVIHVRRQPGGFCRGEIWYNGQPIYNVGWFETKPADPPIKHFEFFIDGYLLGKGEA